jgi:hypothetical protein
MNDDSRKCRLKSRNINQYVYLDSSFENSYYAVDEIKDTNRCRENREDLGDFEKIRHRMMINRIW